jgi:hypothetical protein
MNKCQSKKRGKRTPSQAFKIIVEKHADGYVAYSLGLRAWWSAKATAMSKRCPT